VSVGRGAGTGSLWPVSISSLDSKNILGAFRLYPMLRICKLIFVACFEENCLSFGYTMMSVMRLMYFYSIASNAWLTTNIVISPYFTTDHSSYSHSDFRNDSLLLSYDFGEPPSSSFFPFCLLWSLSSFPGDLILGEAGSDGFVSGGFYVLVSSLAGF